ncbi:SDR family NAD(P)-dependent oxidoreductase [Poseidonocella sp. HB161398]|uniref:SDR family NAD(P)-dependent oxidoreductase n=1 Tax=Poseidonocella sp. HB161398 TaxID=2320855 RepID=UPI001108E5FE|nr:SDR family oxidoreductase [Poseidonocella sp. HB161398]
MADPQGRDGPRRVLVTGASSGIGAAVAAHLAGAGWQVTGMSRRPPAEMPELDHVAADLSDGPGLSAALAALPPVDAVVHAAGLLRVGPLDSFDHAAGEAMWRLHVDALARLIGGLAPRMAPGGRIVAIGSRVAAGAPGRALYAASKAALQGLVRSAAAELAPRGITVNIVAPGATDTPMLRDPARAAEPPKLPPIGRMIAPEEVAGTVGFLLSPNAGAITGQSLVICGGGSL